MAAKMPNLVMTGVVVHEVELLAKGSEYTINGETKTRGKTKYKLLCIYGTSIFSSAANKSVTVSATDYLNSAVEIKPGTYNCSVTVSSFEGRAPSVTIQSATAAASKAEKK